MHTPIRITCISSVYAHYRYINLCTESQHPLSFDLLQFGNCLFFKQSYLEAVHLLTIVDRTEKIK